MLGGMGQASAISMVRAHVEWDASRVAPKSLFFGLVFFALPYPYYFWSRATGQLMSESGWWAQGMNHGPWRWEWPAALVLVPMYALLIGAVALAIAALVVALQRKLLRHACAIGAVAGLYFAMLAIQLFTLFWTVD